MPKYIIEVKNDITNCFDCFAYSTLLAMCNLIEEPKDAHVDSEGELDIGMEYCPIKKVGDKHA